MLSRKIRVLAFVTIIVLFPLKLNEINATDENPGPFFSVSVIAPATCPGFQYQWVNHLVEMLPEIGITIDELLLTGWGNIYPRTWSYPGPYPIPNHTLGGYDIFTVGWSWRFEYDPIEIYHSNYIVPNGDNAYQYSNPEMDWILENYTTALDKDTQLFWAKEMQRVFFEDQPSITILYPSSVIPHDSELTGWDPQLWLTESQFMENWTIPSQTAFNYAVPVEFDEFHLYKSDLYYNYQWLKQIYGGLIERSASEAYTFSPKIATSWDTTDGLNYTVQLNPEVVWADGTPFNASDVEFSYKLLITPEFNANDYHYWEDYLRNNSITILDEHTLHISFNKSTIFRERNLAVDIIPKHIWMDIPYVDMNQQAVDWAKTNTSKFIGTGPYKLHQYDDINQIIHLKQNEYYDNWTNITPYFEDIYFKFYSNYESALVALEDGSLDMIDSSYYIPSDQIPDSFSQTVVPEPGVHEFALNNMHPYFGSGEFCPIAGHISAKYIRKAISHIIPRDQIIEDVLGGKGIPGITPFPITSIGFDDTLEPYEYNKTKALEYMQLAGFDVNPTFISPTISLGINFEILLGILVLIGGCLVIRNKNNFKKS
jgi:ABC-type transport system substrate-binding protein